MFAYYLNLAVRSLKRNVILTTLMIAAIGVGIGASMTTLTVFRAMSGNPIPEKSQQLFAVQIGNWDPQRRVATTGDPEGLQPQLTYIDVMALMKAHAAARQTAMYATGLALTPNNPEVRPYLVQIRATYTDFFPMFQVPFLYGAPWPAADDDNHADVVVITTELNDKVFGGANSVGKTLNLDGRDYRIVGVTQHWSPTPKFYDLNNDQFGESEEIYLPFTRAIDAQMPSFGNYNCSGDIGEPGWDGRLRSECVWFQFWAELPTPAAAARYRAFLNNYASDQRRAGRFQWLPRTRLRDVREWMDYQHVVKNAARILVLVSFSFLFVCLLNAMGLMLAKIMGRAADIGVRRALGASRRAIFGQCLIEAGVIGLVGAILGLLLTVLGLWALRALLSEEVGPPDAFQPRGHRHRGGALARRRPACRALSHLACRARAAGVATQSAVRYSVDILPILSAMRRNKVGAVLIGLQMAVTLAILCNGLFIVEQRLSLSSVPTGVDEANIFVITNQWVGNPPDLKARTQADLAALRSLPGVVAATATNSYPLSNGGSSEGVKLDPDQRQATTTSALYLVDQQGLATMGVKLIAGRNFNADEVLDKAGFDDQVPPSCAIITRALAEKLFPGQNALGKSMYVQFQKHTVPIVGIVDRLQVPWVGGDSWAGTFQDNSIIEPYRFSSGYSYYMIRTQPGQLAGVLQAAEKQLYQVSRERVLQKAVSMQDARIKAYKDDRGLAIILIAVCAALLAVTAFGIVGLTSYWVAQRRRQIGIRRALGATRNAIIRYFQTENFMIAISGAAVGVALAVALNLWMVSSFSMARLNTGYALVGAVVVLLLGQAAVLWPAMKAASVPPALATRGGP